MAREIAGEHVSFELAESTWVPLSLARYSVKLLLQEWPHEFHLHFADGAFY